MIPETGLRERASVVYKILVDFYGEPTWRNPLPPVDELVSTILSQNTNDINRDKAFFAMKHRFPTWQNVMDAPVEQVVDSIRVAGLANQKGPRIQQVLREITQERGSLDLTFLADMPLEDARSWLMKFNGVGPKTAAIVLLFSLNRPAFPVDTHIYRVTERIGLHPPTMPVEAVHTLMEAIFDPGMFYAGHLNIIRLGREICTARKALCALCPLTSRCDYYAGTLSNSE